jgi:predicted dehydrogenase
VGGVPQGVESDRGYLNYQLQAKELMNCLIIGYGSIGARHAGILKEMGHSVNVVSKRTLREFPCYQSIKEALADRKINYVIISNETFEHYSSFMELNELGYSGKLLIEKPGFFETYPLPESGYKNVFVAYNLRFYPAIQKLRELLQNEQIYSICAYAGQYLPDWRPGTDYSKSYSSSQSRGGGVLRDLSHELDYLIWLLEGWERVTAIGGHFSPLDITSDDVFALAMVTPRCPVVTVQLNYLDRMARRFIVVNTAEHTIEADLIKGTIMIDRNFESFDIEKNTTYQIMHKSIMDGGCETVCSLAEGVEVIRLIEAAELSNEKIGWIER